MHAQLMDQRVGGDLRQARIEHPRLPVLMLSGFAELDYATTLLRQGASGYLNKECDPEEIANAIRTVARPTWWRRANCRIEHPSTRASRRIRANNSIRVSITALQQLLASEQARCHNTEVGSAQTVTTGPASRRWAWV